MTTERRSIQRPIELRAEQGKPNTITGYAAVFHDPANPATEFTMWDDPEGRGVERIMPGAFDGVLADDCRALFDHESCNLLGRSTAGTLRLSVDAVGLRYEIDLPDTQLGRDLPSLIQRGDLTGSSFAFTVASGGANWLTEPGLAIRVVSKIGRLWDVGPVTYPAYAGATAGMRAAPGEISDLRAELQRVQDAGRVAAESRARRAWAVGLGL